MKFLLWKQLFYNMQHTYGNKWNGLLGFFLSYTPDYMKGGFPGYPGLLLHP